MEPVIVALSTKSSILISFLVIELFICKKKKAIQKPNLEEKGSGMNKGLALLEFQA